MHERRVFRRRVETGVFERDEAADLLDDTKILLVDDSPYKALKNPQFTSIHPREWIAFGDGDETRKSGYKDDDLSENGNFADIWRK